MRYILDFDYTLFNTEAMRQALIEALASYGVTEGWYRDTERQVKADGLYTLEAHLALLAKGGAIEQLVETSMKVLENAEQFVYPDVWPFLKNIQEADVTILSFGSPVWQDRKIRDSGVGVFADHVITTDGDKAESIQQYAGREVIVINDRGSEIDSMYSVMPQAKYIWLRRTGTPYVDEACQWYTEEVNELSLGLVL